MSKIQKLVVGVVGSTLCAVSTFAESAGITAMQTEATTLIADALAAVTAIVIAGFAITGVLWVARKLRAGIRGA